MCVAVNASCTNIFVYKYDGRTGFSSCANFQELATNLVPNQIERIIAEIYVPYGIPKGNLSTTWWYFVGS